MTNNVPVIDITRLEERATLEAIDLACREWGFFQVIRHGIDQAVIDAIFAVSRAFFAQPAGEKRKVLRDADNPWGFYDRELTRNRRDWKEIYDYGPADGAGIEPRWPRGLFRLRFEPAVRAYYAGARTLAMRLLAAIATNLGVAPEILARGFDGPHTSFLRLNFYPKCPPADGGASADGPLGVGQHTDAGALTLLLQDAQPGLEVCRDGRWHRVEPRSDALVINIGDIVQVWSNDRYRAAVHRVITNAGADRYSVPFFLNPSYDTDYEPLPARVTARNPARYRRINWREFRTLRAAGDYADLGEEVRISHYRV